MWNSCAIVETHYDRYVSNQMYRLFRLLRPSTPTPTAFHVFVARCSIAVNCVFPLKRLAFSFLI